MMRMPIADLRFQLKCKANSEHRTETTWLTNLQVNKEKNYIFYISLYMLSIFKSFKTNLKAKLFHSLLVH